MSKIYQPTGRAGEYCDSAVNLYNGCSHGCTYCYAAKMAARFGRGPFNEPIPCNDVIANIEKDAHEYTGREVFLCFTTDPYNSLDEEHRLTRQAIQILHANGVKVRILTKAGLRSERDFDLLAAHPDLSYYGATLTFLDAELSRTWEPGAAPPDSRLAALEKAHRMGIPTWVSLEPVIHPAQSLGLIKATSGYVDMFKIGKLNHNAKAKDIDWKKFGHAAIELCKKYGKDCYIKEDLRACL